MKKLIVCLATLVALSMAMTGCKKFIPAAALPQPIQSFLQTNFAGVQVSYATKELCEYEVLLMDGTELEFKTDGEWKSIDMKHAVVPAGVFETVPPSIKPYIESSFPNIPICKIKKGFWYGYKIELANDLELYFSSDGVFKRIDD